MPARERVGIIGWNYPEWRDTVYPAGMKPTEFLRAYAKLFPIVEVASSFYRAPDAETVAGWAEATPPGFELSLKVPDWIVKKPGDPAAAEGLASFAARLAPLKEERKLGALVAQFPATFKREKREADLRKLVAAMPKGRRWAVELRHDSWWHPDTYSTLSDAGVTLVWSSVEAGRTPPVVTSDSLYLRLFLDRELQPPYGKKRRDKTDEIRYWADRIRDEGKPAKRVDVMMSKFLEGYAPGSAATMCGLLGLPAPDLGPKAAVPEKGPRQTTLD